MSAKSAVFRETRMPPTCNTVFACAAIAGSSWIKTANIAMGLALAGFLLPFSWAYNPGLFLMGGPLNVARCFIFAAISVLCLAVTTVGYWVRPANVIERILFFAAATLMLFPTLSVNIIGLALAALLTAAHFYLGRKTATAREAVRIAK